MAAGDSYPTSGFYIALLRQILGDLEVAFWRLLLDAGDPVGHIAFVEVLQDAAIVQEEIEITIQSLLWLMKGHWIQPCLAIGEGEVIEIEDWLVGAVLSDRPLERLVPLEPLE